MKATLKQITDVSCDIKASDVSARLTTAAVEAVLAETIVEGFKILKEPEDVATSVGEIISFSVVALKAASYQWQYSRDGTRWFRSSADGATTPEVTFRVTNSNKTNVYRCVIIDEDGDTHYTRVARIIEA